MGESRRVLEALAGGAIRVSDMPAIIGVTKQRCHQLASRPDFPAPLQIVPRRRLWAREDVERWCDERRHRVWYPVEG